MDSKTAMPGLIETQLRAWGAELDRLKAKVERSIAEVRQDHARRKALKGQLSELKDASGEAWEDVMTGAVKGWAELRPALHSAISKFT